MKRSLENGWGTEGLKVQQMAEDEKRQREQRQKERARLEREAEQKRKAKIKAHDRHVDLKVQMTLERLPDSELERIKAEALTEAESKVPKPKEQQGQLRAAAKEKLAVLQDHERQELYEKAQAVVESSIGGLISKSHPGFQRAVDNQVLKEIQKRYPLKTPQVIRRQAKVQAEAQRIVKHLIIKNYGPFNVDRVAEAL